MGSVRAASSSLEMAETSGLRTTPPTLLRAVRAAARTLGWVSEWALRSCGTTWGRQAPSCLGAQKAVAPSMRMEACLVRHWVAPRPSRREGMTSLTPWAESLRITAREAPAAARRTSFSWSP